MVSKLHEVNTYRENQYFTARVNLSILKICALGYTMKQENNSKKQTCSEKWKAVYEHNFFERKQKTLKNEHLFVHLKVAHSQEKA